MMNPALAEREKYEAIWEVPEYKDHSPGLINVPRFLSVMQPKLNAGHTLLDIGCGSGAAGLKLRGAGLDVWWTDITDAALLPDIPRDRFIQGPLWSSSHDWYNYGFCCDVMEHIPVEYTMLVLHRILSYCGKVWFQIALRPDVFGQTIGQPLHLSVFPFTWWRDRLAAMSNLIEARDLLADGLFICSRK